MTEAPTVGGCSERALIARLRERLDAPPPFVRIGPGDDAAIVEPARNLVEAVTTDVCVEGVHFDSAFVPPAAIGHRALAVNLSDLAAMGAAPRVATLSIVMPPGLPLAAFDALVHGFSALAREHRTALVGGNLSSSPGPLVVDVAAIGAVHGRKVLTRAGARPGDHVYVSGSLGGARAGLARCRASGDGSVGPDASDARARYLWPQPRVRLGLLLGRMRAATSCVDLSDGLGDGLVQLADASGRGMRIDGSLLPIDPEARQWFEDHGEDVLQSALAGGDDYELLFTVAPRRLGRLRAAARLVRGLALTRIGLVTASPGVLVEAGGDAFPVSGGYSHFGRD
jgi:thiamine-monophosphate kinase